MPQLEAEPRQFTTNGERYIILLYSDWGAVVRELVGACLALGGSPKDCGAD
jgi:hypothetical protein